MATELFLNRPADAGPTPDETGFNAEPSEYVEHFHTERNHQGKGNILLFPRDTDRGREGPVPRAIGRPPPLLSGF